MSREHASDAASALLELGLLGATDSMQKSPESRRILVAHGDEESGTVIEKILQALGHDLIGPAHRHQRMAQLLETEEPELVVSSVFLEDGDAIELLAASARHRPVPSIIVTDRKDIRHVERAADDHVMSFLSEPVTAEDLRPCILLVMRRFAEFEALQSEVEDLQYALEARKIIEKAKGALMKLENLDEAAAFRKLQKLASRTRRKLLDVATSILSPER